MPSNIFKPELTHDARDRNNEIVNIGNNNFSDEPHVIREKTNGEDNGMRELTAATMNIKSHDQILLGDMGEKREKARTVDLKIDDMGEISDKARTVDSQIGDNENIDLELDHLSDID